MSGLTTSGNSRRGSREFREPEALVDAVIEQVGSHIVLALPLGLGKANHIANALTRRAVADTSLSLEIITALTLETPSPATDLERRFLEPASSRWFGDYPALDYVQLIRTGELPDNIKVSEFFLLAGKWLGVDYAQQHYIPANYTHALGFIVDKGVNVVAQLLAPEPSGQHYSLSCNPDISPDLIALRQQGQADFLLVGQVNSELPYMSGVAEIASEELDFLLNGPDTDFQLYGIPKRPVSLQEQAIGLHTARLVRDGGTLQIGIGSIGDAIAQALILRHQDPACFCRLLDALGRPSDTGLEQDRPFEAGLYGLSEMFVDGFLQLYTAGILKRTVDHAVFHGAFFVDSRDFYRRLRELPAATRNLFQMRPVSFTNELYGNEVEKRRARVKATFINNSMMATLRGAVVSDALEDGRVVSGVGGQYNFAAQAFALADARFVITLNASRLEKGKPVSNIVWSYGHETLPWHLRDVIVTEYGVADLRGKTENEAIKAMLLVTDSRFQDELLDAAKNAGKLDSAWHIPPEYKNNLPALIEKALRPAKEEGVLSPFPFGTEFSDEEQRLLTALAQIKFKAHSRWELIKLAMQGLYGPELNEFEKQCLGRLNLQQAEAFRHRLYKWLVTGALRLTRETR